MFRNNQKTVKNALWRPTASLHWHRKKLTAALAAVSIQHMTRVLCVSFMAVAVAVSVVSHATAEEPAPQLHLQTAGGQTTYRIGERIPLELSFTGPGDKRFAINTASYDRSGRMMHEAFEVTPSNGWADPLAKYFSTGFAGGGIFGFGDLSTKPVVLHLNMNEWVRFDTPGTYKLVIVSDRVSITRYPRTLTNEDYKLTSNSIDLKIVAASPAWQRTKLAAIVDELHAEPATQGMQPPNRLAAIADLRFLATPAAAHLMAQHLRDDEQDVEFQCGLGLAGLPENLHRGAVTALNELIADPNFPVSTWLLSTMTVLQLSDGSAEMQLEERRQLFNSDWARVLAALPGKKGAARAATAQALLSQLPDGLTPEMKASLGGVLAASFKDLPPEKQVPELEYHWDLLRSADMLSTLKHLATLPLKNPGSNESNAYTRRELKGAALERWFELDPEGARQEALSQVGSMHPSLTAGSLAFLQNTNLPQFENIWADAFMTTDDFQEEAVLLSLMTRFGTGSAVSLVHEKANKKIGNWTCAAQSAALGYLLKFDAEGARPLIERAIAERGAGKTQCNHSSFQEISQYATGPVLTRVAVQALGDADPQVTNDALIYLMSYADESAEEPIWNRYVEWSDKWRGHSEALEALDSAGDWVERGLGENLGRALIANQGWLADRDLMARVVARCVGEQMCTQLRVTVEYAGPPYLVSVYRARNSESYGVAQYSAKSLTLLDEKIAQFPNGTKFVLAPKLQQAENQTALEDEVKKIFEKNGMALQVESGP